MHHPPPPPPPPPPTNESNSARLDHLLPPAAALLRCALVYLAGLETQFPSRAWRHRAEPPSLAPLRSTKPTTATSRYLSAHLPRLWLWRITFPCCRMMITTIRETCPPCPSEPRPRRPPRVPWPRRPTRTRPWRSTTPSSTPASGPGRPRRGSRGPGCPATPCPTPSAGAGAGAGRCALELRRPEELPGHGGPQLHSPHFRGESPHTKKKLGDKGEQG